MTTRGLLSLVMIVASVPVTGCGSPTSTTGPVANSISLGLSVTDGVAAASGTIEFGVVVGRTGDSRTAVSLSVDSPPAGVTDSITSLQTSSNGTTTALITLYVDPLTPAAVYPLTVRAKADGLADATALFTLTVIPLGTGTFTLHAELIAISRGAADIVPITIVRLGFPGTITLSALNVPEGVVSFMSPGQTTGNVASLTLTVGSNVSLGQYDITIRGTGSGQDVRTTFKLTVQ